MMAKGPTFQIDSTRPGNGSSVVDELIWISPVGTSEDAAQRGDAEAQPPSASADATAEGPAIDEAGLDAAQDTVADPSASSKKVGRAPSGATAKTGTRQQVAASFLSAKTRPGEWTTMAVRLPDGVHRRLLGRLIYDRVAQNRPGLAVGHYVNAALTKLPPVKTAADWAETVIIALDGASLVGDSTGARVHQTTKSGVQQMEGRLRLEYRYGLNSYFIVAAVMRFLDQLDAEDPIPEESQDWMYR